MSELGADMTIDASVGDPVAQALEWTGGRGVDFAIDAVGNTQCRQNSIACTASGGTIICIGLEEEVCAVDTRSIVTRELDVKGAYAYTRSDFAEALSCSNEICFRGSGWSRKPAHTGSGCLRRPGQRPFLHSEGRFRDVTATS